MRTIRIPNDRVDTPYVNFVGGIDMTSPTMSIKPGNALVAMNYEPGIRGGYRRIDGFERLDGRPAPSAASYMYLEGTISGTIPTGSTVTGATSGATGVVILVDQALRAVCVTKTTGAFVKGEQLLLGGAPVCTLTYQPAPRGYRTAKGDAIARAAAADLYRADIGKVPGSGPVRGVWLYKGVRYAWRNTADGTALAMYKATPTGWQLVDLGREMQISQPQALVTSTGSTAYTINWTAHGLPNGSLVQFSGTLPTGIATNTTYYVINAAANTFQVASSPTGAAIQVTAVASGLICLPLAQQINDGDTIKGMTSGVTATVKRAALRTGGWSSFAMTGTLALANVQGGVFVAGEALSVNGVPKVGASTADTAITLQPGGRVECINYNFTGDPSTARMYGCDGKNKAFEFDGTAYLPLRTGMATDTPSFIKAHKKKLFLSFGGSVQYSGDGTPYAWTLLTGANDIGMGDTITGMDVQTGDTLAIFTRNASAQLNGATNNTFQLLPISNEAGALPYTVQNVGKTLALDDRGVISTDRTQAYGNFVQATISSMIQPIIDALHVKAIGSMVYRNRNQYRIYGSDGSGIIATFSEQGLIGFTQLQYPVNPTCFASCEDVDGSQVVLFGADDGYVYQADTDSSFDGAPIEAFLHMPSNHLNSPRLKKRFRKAVMKMSAQLYAEIRFHPEFSDGDPDIAPHRLQTAMVTGGLGGYYDVSSYDEVFYDARLVNSPEFPIDGTALNMALIFYSNSAIDLGHTLQGMIVHYSPRKLAR